MRLQQLTLKMDGDELALGFHDRLTVVGGIAAGERQQLAEMLLGALAGGLRQPTELSYVDATGQRLRAISDGTGAVRHVFDDGTPAPNIVNVLSLDAASLRKLCVVAGDDLGLLTTDIGEPEPPELSDARQTLASVSDELERALTARQTAEALRCELAAVEEQLRQLNEGEAKRRYARLLIQIEQLRAEVAALDGGTDATDAHERLIDAAPSVHELADRWRAAAARVVQEAETFGNRKRLDADTVARAASAPIRIPENIESLAAAYEKAEAERAAIEHRLQGLNASHLPQPTHPAVLRLGRLDQELVWDTARQALAANKQLEGASLALGGINADGTAPLLVAEIETAHAGVEAAENVLAGRRVPALSAGTLAVIIVIAGLILMPLAAPVGILAAMAVAAWATVLPKRQLEQAQAKEDEVLERAGIPTYLAFHMRRIDATITPQTLDALQTAASVHKRATSRWTELAGELDPAEALLLEAEVRAYSDSLASADGSGAIVEDLRHRLVTEAQPAAAQARDRLVAACRPFGVDNLKQAVKLVREKASVATTARLQQALEEAEREEETLGQKLDARLAELGFDEGDLEARVGGFEWALSTAEERVRTRAGARPLHVVQDELRRLETQARREGRPEWATTVTPADAEEPDPVELERRRSELASGYATAQRIVPDVQRLTDRRNAMERRVSVLESNLGITSNGAARATAAEVEPTLQARLAQLRRPGSHDETLPLVLDEAFSRLGAEAKWSMLDMIDRIGAQAQVVYLTDDPEVITWARRRVGAGSLSLLEPVAEAV